MVRYLSIWTLIDIYRKCSCLFILLCMFYLAISITLFCFVIWLTRLGTQRFSPITFTMHAALPFETLPVAHCDIGWLQIILRRNYTIICYAYDILTRYHLFKTIIYWEVNRFGGVMVSVLASSVVDRGSSPGRVKPKIINLVCVASPLSMQH